MPELSLLELAEVSAASVSAALERLYQDRELLQEMSITAYRGTTEQATFTWADAARQFRDLFFDLQDSPTQ